MNKATTITFAISSILALAVLLWLGSSSQGAAIWQWTPEYRQTCPPGTQASYVQETRFGTGKDVVAECVPIGTSIQADAVPFPALRQRYREPNLRRTYY